MKTTNEQIAPEVAEANKKKEQHRIFKNQITVARGTRTTINEDSQVTFGFTDLMAWSPKTQSWLPLSPLDNDKFLVTADDFSTACAEFWARWRIYCKRRFNLNYVKIETN